jgi:uncharacterized BrkB/YihY/UPF0761 family membrane protein
MIMIIVWINLTALMLLVGFELNASIYIAKQNKTNGGEGPEGEG